MITASHLPYNRNGLKFFTENGGLEKKEVKEVLTLASKLSATAVSTAAIASLDLIERYALHLRQKICAGLRSGMYDRPWKGCTSRRRRQRQRRFLCEKSFGSARRRYDGSQFLEPDGHFPNISPIRKTKKLWLPSVKPSSTISRLGPHLRH